MLAALLLAGLFTAPLCSAAMFIRLPWQGRVAGAWARIRRLGLALFGTLVVCALIYLPLRLLSVATRNIEVSVAAFAFASLLFLPITRRWSARAHLAWSSALYLFAGYLAYMFWWTFASRLGTAGTVGGMALWALECAAALLGIAYLWETCDALGTELWRRRLHEGVVNRLPDEQLPFVSLHVPAYNEPPEMVISTLRNLLALDYPNYEVVVIDDNTADPKVWGPVQEWSQAHGIRFAHLENWPGYKSGALNYALRNLTDERAELIGVVDADYEMNPEFLLRCAPLFADPKIGFVQAPQDYRSWERVSYLRRLYYSYSYFFAVSQPSRNERNGAIFAGTMGLIRKSALEAVGGWDEWCITEDAELSLRMLRAGWSGLHIDRSFGKGVMPLTFEALKGQRFRWCFGGIQILRMHWRSLLPGRRSADNQLSLRQRWAYLSGAIQWYGDLLALLFLFFLLIGTANLAGGGGLVFRKLSGFLLGAVPVLVALGLIRAVALVRRGTGASLRDALGAFMIWQSTSLVVARASVQALFAREAEFLRTPKSAQDVSLSTTLRGNWAEILLGLLGLGAMAAALAGSPAHPAISALLSALLVWPTLSMLLAPVNSIAAQRASLPPELRARRRTEALRERRRVVTGVVTGAGLAAALGGAALVAALLFTPSPGAVRTPPLIGPARGIPVAPVVTGVRTRRSPASSPAHSATPHPSPSGPTHSATPNPSPSAATVSPTPRPSPFSSPTPSVTASPSSSASPSQMPYSSPSAAVSYASPSPPPTQSPSPNPSASGSSFASAELSSSASSASPASG
ncbi:MAG: glycosyltransferase [Mycobacteriales bacterium]